MLQKDTAAKHNLVIEAYTDSSVTISGKQYHLPALITPTEVFTDPENWVATACQLKPDLVLFGTGNTFIMPNPAQFAELYALNIGVESMSNASACRTHIALLSENRLVVTWLSA